MERIGNLPIEIPRREVYRYMGYKNGETPDEEAGRIIEDCIRILQETAVCSGIYRRDPLLRDGERPENMVIAGGIDVSSKSLEQNLRRCNETILVAATLSAGVDVLLRRYSGLDVMRALTLQAASAAMIEAYLDALEENLLASLSKEGLALRPRFSPGFGDFGTEYQGKVLDALQAGKLLGIRQALDSDMMIPSKSVTALMGVCKMGDTRVDREIQG